MIRSSEFSKGYGNKGEGSGVAIRGPTMVGADVLF